MQPVALGEQDLSPITSWIDERLSLPAVGEVPTSGTTVLRGNRVLIVDCRVVASPASPAATLRLP